MVLLAKCLPCSSWVINPPMVVFETGRIMCGGLGAASKKWTRSCDYFSICSSVIYTDPMHIKRSCYIWQNSRGCTINNREDHLLLSNLYYIKAAWVAHSDWLTAGLQWQVVPRFHNKKSTGPKPLEYHLKDCEFCVWGKGNYLLFVHLPFRVPYFLSDTFGHLFLASF